MQLTKKTIYLLFLFFSTSVYAGVEVHSFANQQQEQQYIKLTEELRCLVCQNQNLAGSDAELAQDLRKQIIEMIDAGKSEEEIIEYMVARYGDFVLYRPPLDQRTFILWVGPFLILLTGLIVLVVFVRRQQHKEKPTLSAEQQVKAKKLLNEEGDE